MLQIFQIGNNVQFIFRDALLCNQFCRNKTARRRIIDSSILLIKNESDVRLIDKNRSAFYK